MHMQVFFLSRSLLHILYVPCIPHIHTYNVGPRRQTAVWDVTAWSAHASSLSSPHHLHSFSSFAFSSHPSIHQDFLDTGRWQGHIHSLVVHHLYKGAGMGRGCGAVPNSFTSWDRARFLFVLFPFSFVSAEWVHYLSDTQVWSVMDSNHCGCHMFRSTSSFVNS